MDKHHDGVAVDEEFSVAVSDLRLDFMAASIQPAGWYRQVDIILLQRLAIQQ